MDIKAEEKITELRDYQAEATFACGAICAMLRLPQDTPAREIIAQVAELMVDAGNPIVVDESEGP